MRGQQRDGRGAAGAGRGCRARRVGAKPELAHLPSRVVQRRAAQPEVVRGGARLRRLEAVHQPQPVLLVAQDLAALADAQRHRVDLDEIGISEIGISELGGISEVRTSVISEIWTFEARVRSAALRRFHSVGRAVNRLHSRRRTSSAHVGRRIAAAHLVKLQREANPVVGLRHRRAAESRAAARCAHVARRELWDGHARAQPCVASVEAR